MQNKKVPIIPKQPSKDNPSNSSDNISERISDVSSRYTPEKNPAYLYAKNQNNIQKKSSAMITSDFHDHNKQEDQLEWLDEDEKNGLPKGISTEAQLWDEILKKEVLEMPFLLLPVIKEVHGISYPRDTEIIPFGTEYSVERVITKDISSIRSDSAVNIYSSIYHFECEIDTDTIIVKRTYEYDSQAALSCSKKGTKEVPWRLFFPYSAVLFLEPGIRVPNRLACELCLPIYSAETADRDIKTQIKSVEYAVPALKVQEYTLQEIREKNLLILIPFTPIRFRTMLKKKKRSNFDQNNINSDFDQNSAKLELTNFYHEIILLLDDAVKTGFINELNRKDILALLRKAFIRVFHEDEFLLEVVNKMTAPVLELERETIVRLQKENDAMEYENNFIKAENSSIKAENSVMKSTLEEKDAIIKALTEENNHYRNRKRKWFGKK